MAEIRLAGVKKTYLKQQVIHGVDIEIVARPGDGLQFRLLTRLMRASRPALQHPASLLCRPSLRASGDDKGAGRRRDAGKVRRSCNGRCDAV